MAAFFSSTDWSQLEDRGVLCNYFLMLIVNFDGKYCAKVAFKAEKKGFNGVTLEFCNNSDGFAPMDLTGKQDKEVLVVMDCRIEWEKAEILVEQSFEDRYNKVKKAIEDEKPKAVYNRGAYDTGAYQGWKPRTYNGLDDEQWTSKELNQGELFPVGNKSVMEMTDAEWKEHTQAEDSPIIYDKRQAFALVNSVMEGVTIMNFSSPIKHFLKKNSELKKKSDIDTFVIEFLTMARENFDTIFPGTDTDDYIEIMEIIIEEFTPYAYNRLIKELIEGLNTEVENYLKYSV